MLIDYAPVKDCKHPEWTYGEICVQCNECGRFNYGGVNNPVQSDIQIISQFHSGIPPFWELPQREATFYKGEWAKHRTKSGKWEAGKLTEVIPQCWYNRELDYTRWWIEGRNY